MCYESVGIVDEASTAMDDRKREAPEAAGHRPGDAADFLGPKPKTPAALPRAMIGWTHWYPGSDLSAVACGKPRTNPGPDVVIRSIDRIGGPDVRERGWEEF